MLAASVDINDMWSILQETLTKAIDDCSTLVPLQTIYVRRKLRVLFLRKKRRWRQWKKLSTQKSKSRFAAAANKLSVALKRYEKEEENAILSRSASHFFRHVSSPAVQNEQYCSRGQKR